MRRFVTLLAFALAVSIAAPSLAAGVRENHASTTTKKKSTRHSAKAKKSKPVKRNKPADKKSKHGSTARVSHKR